MRAPQAMLTSILVLASSACLFAQDPQWGVQGALSLPAGDLTDSAAPGLQGGAHLRWDFGNGHGLMARGDLTLFGQKEGYSSSSFGVGADYTYHVERNRRGLYFLAGLAVVNYHWYQDDGTPRNDADLGLALGVGYDLDRHVGFQARYTTSSGAGSSLDALNLGVTYTF